MSSEIFQSMVLGMIQGLGEFLPISSTAHLILAPYFFGWKDPGLAFDVALHIGTLIAVVAFLWKDWKRIIFSFQFSVFNKKIKSKNSNSPQLTHQEINNNPKLLAYIIIATLPGVLVGYFLETKAETIFRNPLVVALTLSVFGLILYLVDKYSSHRKNLEKVSLKDSIIVGLSQAVAIIPGVSRSGATITAGLLTGLNRTSAARFSFLLSTPIIFGAAVLKIPYLIQEGISVPIVMGIIISAVSGYLAIKYLLKLVAKASYAAFFWYRLALAIIILIFYLAKQGA